MIHLSIDTLTKEMQKHYDGTLEENQKSLEDIIKVLADLVESLAAAKVEIPTWKYHIQTLVGKIIFTSHSIITLTKGYNYGFFKDPENKLPIIDYSSLCVLTRALIENYLTLCYIYNNDLTDEEKIFRYKLWELSGLQTRQNFKDPKNNLDAQKKKDEAELIHKIFTEIEKMNEFSLLNKRHLQNLREFGVPRVESWHALIEKSDLSTPLFGNLYSLYSSYVHSEYLSVLQISQSNYSTNSPVCLNNAMHILNTVRMINARTINFYTNNFTSAKLVLNTYPSTILTAISIWANVASTDPKEKK